MSIHQDKTSISRHSTSNKYRKPMEFVFKLIYIVECLSMHYPVVAFEWKLTQLKVI